MGIYRTGSGRTFTLNSAYLPSFVSHPEADTQGHVLSLIYESLKGAFILIHPFIKPTLKSAIQYRSSKDNIKFTPSITFEHKI
jgi:hypothetical protein